MLIRIREKANSVQQDVALETDENKEVVDVQDDRDIQGAFDSLDVNR